MNQRTGYLITVSCLMLVATFMLVQSFSFPSLMGVAYGFGPAIYPRLVTGGILLCGVISIIQVLREKGEDTRIDLKWENLKRPALLLGMGLVYVIVLQKLGFLITNTGFLIVTLLAYKNSKAVAVMIAVGATAVIFGLFKMFLSVPLPPGLLF